MTVNDLGICLHSDQSDEVHSCFLPIKEDGLPDHLAAREANKLLTNMIIDLNGRNCGLPRDALWLPSGPILPKSQPTASVCLATKTCERILSAIWLKRLNPNLIVSKDIHPYFPVVTLPTPISSVIPSTPVKPSHFNGLVLHAQVLAGKVGFPAGWNYCPPRRAPSVLRRVCSGMAGVLDLMIEINYYGILSIRSPWHTMHR